MNSLYQYLLSAGIVIVAFFLFYSLVYLYSKYTKVFGWIVLGILCLGGFLAATEIVRENLFTP